MPMLGIMASGISGNLWAPAGAYDSIFTTTLASAAGTITFSSIPATYTHLQLRILGGSAYSSVGPVNNTFRLNNDTTGTNYYRHQLGGTGASTYSGSGNDNLITGYIPGAGNFGTIIIDILDYANTNKYKTIRTLGGFDANGQGYAVLESMLWKNTAAVNRIDILDGYNWTTNSSFSLYGVK